MKTRNLFPAVTAALLLLFLSASPASAQLTLLENLQGKAQLQVMGDVKTVLDGVSTGPEFRKIEINSFLAGLGCASVHDDETSQGETLFLGGHAFVKSVDPATSYTTEKRLGHCWGSFVAGLTSTSVATARYKLDTTSPLAVDNLYKLLHERHGAMVAVIAVADFESLELSAVRRAPVYGDPILGPKKAEYFHPVEKLANTRAVMFGMSLRSNAEANATSRKIFYINPDDRLSTAGQSHTHCGMFRKPYPVTIDPTKAAPAIEKVAHVLTQSRIKTAEILAYEIKPDRGN